ncbi:hypothetical protein LCGC14_0383050 [marine sediment metagenome]|uniref:Uncharacterized protein n=1 Tax=marine sediment metagenome TaxID=412755 RepID=A0A0F9VNT6_9ZZZZ
MVFDNELVLRDDTADLDSSEVVAVALAVNSDGARVADLNSRVRPRGDSEGVIHLTATLTLPGAPSTYQVNLALNIQQSDNLGFGWETIASFPTLYSFTRMISVTVTTAFVAADIGGTLTGQSTNDTGTLRWMHPDALTVGKVANLIINMDAVGDVFDNASEEVRAGTTGIGNMTKIGFVEVKPRLGGPGTFTRGFSVTKRYLRGNWTASGGNFGKAQLMLSPYPFKTI